VAIENQKMLIKNSIEVGLANFKQSIAEGQKNTTQKR